VGRLLLDLPNRRVEHSIEARYKIAGVYRACGAEIVFLPHPEDAHPDHRAVTRIAEDARFDAKLSGVTFPGDGGKPALYPKWLIYYYCSHLRRVPDPTLIIDTTGFAERKLRAIRAYASQFVANKQNRDVVSWIESGDRYFGSRIGTPAGEPFFTNEPLGLKGLGDLV
jgi:LmbE family N-acetylglucosaminyl deacetylase